MSDPLPTPPTAATPRSSYPLTGAVIVLLLVAAAGYYFYVKSQNPPPPPVDEVKNLRGFLEKVGTNLKLADGYADANGDLVADAPTDPAKVRKVEEIGFCFIPSGDPERAAADALEWADLVAAVGKATGKKVKYLADVHTPDEQLAALRDGRLHVTACNTGLVPAAVNTAGFVPLFAPADAAGRFAYEMEIIVPAGSPAKSPTDLKGKTVAFVALSSNSGAKAPLVILKEKFNLRPGRDYQFAFTGDHAASIKQLVAGKYDAACVANDLLARAVSSNAVEPGEFRSVYKSEPFPPLCYGVPHDLPPDLLAKIKEAFAGFKFEGTSVGKRFTPQGKVGFAAVDYAKDWKYVREIDASLVKLLDDK
jgi:phosphonate transport system substrate-binding protein